MSEATEFARCEQLMAGPNAVFVFGSNRRGYHGGGAAYVAMKLYDAEFGVGEGLTGRAYALPTMDVNLDPMSVEEIAGRVAAFLDVARANPDKLFVVTRIGCGIAGHVDSDIAPMFVLAPANCESPEGMAMIKRRAPLKRSTKPLARTSAPMRSTKPMARINAGRRARRNARYRARLSRADWRQKRQETFARDGFRCVRVVDGERCPNGRENGIPLHCNHTTYARFGHELPRDLETLCRPCDRIVTRQTRANWSGR